MVSFLMIPAEQCQPNLKYLPCESSKAPPYLWPHLKLIQGIMLAFCTFWKWCFQEQQLNLDRKNAFKKICWSFSTLRLKQSSIWNSSERPQRALGNRRVCANCIQVCLSGYSLYEIWNSAVFLLPCEGDLLSKWDKPGYTKEINDWLNKPMSDLVYLNLC